jgi:hypothetical protein
MIYAKAGTMHWQIVSSSRVHFEQTSRLQQKGDLVQHRGTYNNAICYYQIKPHEILALSSVFAHVGNILVD